jgi:two-component system response regulator YesN
MIHSSILLSKIERLSDRQKTIVTDMVEEFLKTIKPEKPIELFAEKPFSIFSQIRPKDSRLQNFLSYLWKESDPIHADLNRLAFDVNLSLTRLNAICRLQTSQSIGKIAQIFAIEKCKDDLSASDNNLNTIGMDHGFENASHFSKVFKQVTSKSPRDYRRKYLNCSEINVTQPFQNR